MDVLANNGMFQIAQMNAAGAQAKQAANAASKTPHNEKAARAAAESFEAVFLAQMLNTMFETIPKDGMFSGGQGEEMFRGMQVEQFGKEIAKSGGVGIADSIFAEIIKLQEAADASAVVANVSVSETDPAK